MTTQKDTTLADAVKKAAWNSQTLSPQDLVLLQQGLPSMPMRDMHAMSGGLPGAVLVFAQQNNIPTFEQA